MLSDVSHGDTDVLNRSWSFMSELPPRPKRHKIAAMTNDEVQRSRLQKSFSVALPGSKQQKNGTKADERLAEKLNLKKCPQCRVYTLDLARHSEEHRQNADKSEEEREMPPPKRASKAAKNEQKCDECGLFTMDLARHIEERHRTSTNDDDEVDEGAETEVEEDGHDAVRTKRMKKDGTFVRPETPLTRVAPPKKTAKTANPQQGPPIHTMGLPLDLAATQEPSVGVKTYECAWGGCKASGNYATVAVHLQARHGIRGKISLGMDYVEHISGGEFSSFDKSYN